VGNYDLVIVCDFGHGTMTQELIEKVTKEARFLAVNAQTNSQNFGFNLITKYPRADYVVLDELEIRLATHDNHSPIEDLILKLGYKKIVITLGAHGAIGFDREFYRERAEDVRIVDTMGAGDAALCVSAPFAAARFGIKDLVHIANVAGAIKVGMLGHSGHVTKAELEKYS
jgi:sugar/nucleoside kinase (ribokinase family)